MTGSEEAFKDDVESHSDPLQLTDSEVAALTTMTGSEEAFKDDVESQSDPLQLTESEVASLTAKPTKQNNGQWKNTALRIGVVVAALLLIVMPAVVTRKEEAAMSSAAAADSVTSPPNEAAVATHHSPKEQHSYPNQPFQEHPEPLSAQKPVWFQWTDPPEEEETTSAPDSYASEEEEEEETEATVAPTEELGQEETELQEKQEEEDEEKQEDEEEQEEQEEVEDELVVVLEDEEGQEEQEEEDEQEENMHTFEVDDEVAVVLEEETHEEAIENDPTIVHTQNVCPEASNTTETLTVAQARARTRTSRTTLHEWKQMSPAILGEAALDSSGTQIDLSADGTIVAVGAAWNEGVNGRSSGHVRVFLYDAERGEYTQLGQDVDGQAERDWFGSSVALDASGHRFAAGAMFADSEARGTNTGHVRVFDYNEETASWEQLGETLEGLSARDQFGASISLSADGTRLAVGSTHADGANNATDVGHVSLYDLVEGDWKPVGVIVGEGHGSVSGKAMKLSADGTHVAIGAPRYDAPFARDVGQVKVYRYSGESLWSRVGQAISSDQERQQTGFSLAISRNGGRVAVTFPEIGHGSFPFPGATRIYDYNATSEEWDLVGRNGLQGSHYVSMADTGRVAVGDYASYHNGMDSGSVRVYDYHPIVEEWRLVAPAIHGHRLEGSGTAAILTADGSRLAISAPRAKRGEEEQVGATRIYDLC